MVAIAGANQNVLQSTLNQACKNGCAGLDPNMLKMIMNLLQQLGGQQGANAQGAQAGIPQQVGGKACSPHKLERLLKRLMGKGAAQQPMQPMAPQAQAPVAQQPVAQMPVAQQMVQQPRVSVLPPALPIQRNVAQNPGATAAAQGSLAGAAAFAGPGFSAAAAWAFGPNAKAAAYAGVPGPVAQQAPAANANFIKAEKGGWLAKHGGYKKLGDGRFQITKGNNAGAVAVAQGNGKYLVTNNNGQQQTWNAPKGKNKIASPLAFDLNGNGKVDTTNVGNGKAFDINGDGKVDQTAWAGKGDGVLAFDGNKNGKIDGGQELFGNNTNLDDGKKYANGFDALRSFAGEAFAADNILDANELASLNKDKGLGMLVDGKMQDFKSLGIDKINLNYQEAGKAADGNGNEHRQQGSFSVNGQERKANDVWFQYQDRAQPKAAKAKKK